MGCSDVKCETSGGFADAGSAAKASDFVVYVGGVNWNLEGEGKDRSNMSVWEVGGRCIGQVSANAHSHSLLGTVNSCK